MLDVDDFDFLLPESLIAQEPLAERASSRLLVVPQAGDSFLHSQMTRLVDFVLPGDCLVFNDTSVVPARIFGEKETGGAFSGLLDRVLDRQTGWFHLKANHAPKVGSTLLVAPLKDKVSVIERQDGLFKLFVEHSHVDLYQWLAGCGDIPLPPYIKRKPSEADRMRYQTVYAKVPGAVAAPTAGLHFTIELLNQLQNKGVRLVDITLHVGSGTFQPVRGSVEDHVMHEEWAQVSAEACEAIFETQKSGGRIIAVGTTVVRTLEAAATSTGVLRPFSGTTRIFIKPGYQFKVVDVLLTNFHLPKSTLLMLVAAMIGHERVMQVYTHAIESGYRFYSYGDAMLLARNN